jgi:glyoxylase-like metal-dependent hydrolase (beta-lactamase superfamily II)
MKITDEIFQVGGGPLTTPSDGACYLIHFNGHAALIDAGCGSSAAKVLDNVRGCGVPLDRIEYLLITHCHYDHAGGVNAVREAVGCQVVAHELDAVYMEEGNDAVTAAAWYGATIAPTLVDRKLTGERESLPLGDRVVEAIHIPGHSPGSLAFLAESEGKRVLFGQDVHGPLDPSLLSDRTAYQNSLKRLIDLEADILCEGHYGVFRGKAAVARFIKSFMEDDG